VEWETDVLEETCPNSSLSTTDPTKLRRGSIPGRRSGISVTNRQSYGMIFFCAETDLVHYIAIIMRTVLWLTYM
jgi:hypothetical protein